MEKTKAPRRSGGLEPAARGIRAVTAAALGKTGQAFGQLLAHWPQVVGPDLAQKALPAGLTFPKGKNAEATLHLATHSAHALELAHQSPRILERVNSYLGYRAVAQVRLDHRQLPTPQGKVVMGSFRGGAGQAQVMHAPQTRRDAPVPDEVCQIYSDIKDAELRARLESLCRKVAAA